MVGHERRSPKRRSTPHRSGKLLGRRKSLSRWFPAGRSSCSDSEWRCRPCWASRDWWCSARFPAFQRSSSGSCCRSSSTRRGPGAGSQPPRRLALPGTRLSCRWSTRCIEGHRPPTRQRRPPRWRPSRPPASCTRGLMRLWKQKHQGLGHSFEKTTSSIRSLDGLWSIKGTRRRRSRVY